MINSEKIKIMLTREDMTRYDIRTYSLGHTGSAVKEAFSKVLSDVKENTGFDALTSKTILQIYPSRDGGCEVYVTRLTEDEDKNVSGDSKKDVIRSGGNEKTVRYEQTMFAFDNMIDVIDACALLKRLDYGESSSLYLCEKHYYLFLKSRIKPKYAADELMPLSEFGKRINDPIAEVYVCEHGECIIGNDAVSALSI